MVASRNSFFDTLRFMSYLSENYEKLDCVGSHGSVLRVLVAKVSGSMLVFNYAHILCA